MNFRRPHPEPARRIPAWVLSWLLVALLVAPWLGSVHAVLHANSPVAAVVSGDTGTHHPAAAGSDLLRRLFGDHSHNGDCRIYDQLSHADGLHPTLALPPVVLPPVAVLAWHAGECLRRWATLFDARGPPFLV